MVTCPNCGRENASGAKFCNECATALTAAVSGGWRERRVVSVLFADLVGFTSRAERADVEDVDGLLTPYRERLRRDVERFGGVVCDFAGDGVMAVFGAPVAHEDDPERAVRSALAIRDGMALESAQSQSIVGLHIRLGVTSGEVLATLWADGSVDVVGDVVNTGARLQSAAPVDGVLVDEFTYRAADRAIMFEPEEPVVAKGKTDPVAVWKAVEPRSILARARPRIGDHPLIGREFEANLLFDAFERSRSEPSTELVTLVGSPGIGKTRLVEELAAHVDQLPGLVTWRQGRSLAYGEGVAFWAVGEMVKAQASILESDSADQTEAKLRDAVAALVVGQRERDWVERQLRPLVGLEPQARLGGESGRGEAFAAWRRLFEALAADGPTVLVFEDIHWADDGLLDFIDLLADGTGAVPLLIVCTARPELLDRRPGWGRDKIKAHAVGLSPLSEADTARWIAYLLDQVVLPVAVPQSLLARAEGNPLYAQEYVRMLQDRGLLVRDLSGWKLIGAVDGLPESVRGIVAARLDILTPSEKALVQDAAVFGRTAWVGAVCAISDRAQDEAEAIIHALERKQLLRVNRASRVEAEVEFTFGHALTQEVAYGQIRRIDRAEKHLRAVAWIEQLSGERDDKAELLAHHYQVALSLYEQAGSDTRSLVPSVRAALAEAGRQADALSAHSSAARFLNAALALTATDDPGRPRLMLDCATASFHAGHADEAMLASALNAQVAARDWEAAARMSLLLNEFIDYYEGEGERAAAHLAAAARYVSQIPYTHLTSVVAYYETERPSATGARAEQTIERTTQAIRQAERAGDPQGRALLLMRQGVARIATGDIGGVGDAEEAAAILASHSHPRTSVAYDNLARALFGVGEIRRASKALSQSLFWSQRVSYARDIGYAEAALATARYHEGDWQAALVSSAPHTQDDSRLTASLAAWPSGCIAVARGDTGLALRHGQMMIDFGVSTADDESLLRGLTLIATAGYARGEHKKANAARERFLAHWDEVGTVPGAASAAAELASIPAPDDAIRHLGDSLPGASRWGQVLTAIGDHRYVDAAYLYLEIGSQPLEAAAHLLAAHDLLQLGHSVEATHHARLALTFYEHVGATLHVNAATRLLRPRA